MGKLVDSCFIHSNFIYKNLIFNLNMEINAITEAAGVQVFCGKDWRVYWNMNLYTHLGTINIMSIIWCMNKNGFAKEQNCIFDSWGV